MAALGIPAVLSGALGTASTAESVTDLARDADRLRQAVREERRILKEGEFTTLEPLGAPAPARPAAKDAALGIPFIASAHAKDDRPAQAGSNDAIRFGVRVEQPKYVVVLRKAANAQQAVQYAQELRAKLPGARAVRSDKGYFVVLGNAPASETDALLAAAQAKKLMPDEVQPVLVEVK